MERRIFLKGVIGSFAAALAGIPKYILPQEAEIPAKATTIDIGLFKEDGSEVDGSGYKRVKTGPDDWGVDEEGAVAYNKNDAMFPTASEGWGTITHFGLMDARTGHVLASGSIAMVVAPHDGDTLCFSSRAIKVEMY